MQRGQVLTVRRKNVPAVSEAKAERSYVDWLNLPIEDKLHHKLMSQHCLSIYLLNNADVKNIYKVTLIHPEHVFPFLDESVP